MRSSAHGRMVVTLSRLSRSSCASEGGDRCQEGTDSPGGRPGLPGNVERLGGRLLVAADERRLFSRQARILLWGAGTPHPRREPTRSRARRLRTNAARRERTSCCGCPLGPWMNPRQPCGHGTERRIAGREPDGPPLLFGLVAVALPPGRSIEGARRRVSTSGSARISKSTSERRRGRGLQPGEFGRQDLMRRQPAWRRIAASGRARAGGRPPRFSGQPTRGLCTPGPLERSTGLRRRPSWYLQNGMVSIWYLRPCPLSAQLPCK